ncbi:hypothetical protein [Cyclobacterium plantarum]|uniref:Uncharacterized protein n=1 Tax=Cyclobacterium plantarum TaxID=2716263 RepID=A0ABX0HBU4_9BACT|nr:hypothetical protein [Cyclobacterium plantarum]NHE57814.1 hypothetical protein [Cyclobacterium plantarum]
MKTRDLIKEIQKLPVSERFYIIERSMQLIRKQENESQMKKAVDLLYEDYVADEELTAFTDLDFENFYETR